MQQRYELTRGYADKAPHELDLLDSATLRRGPRPIYSTFTEIQRAAHGPAVPAYDTEAARRFLMSRRGGDLNSMVRAVVAYTDPKALKGFDYSTLQQYQELAARISTDPDLSRMEPGSLLDFTLRKTPRPKKAEGILQLARWPTVHGIPELGEINPDLILTSGRRSQLENEAKRNPLIGPALRYLEDVQPRDYEITRFDVDATRALTEIQVGEQSINYRFSRQEAYTHLTTLHPEIPADEIPGKVRASVSKVPEFYLIAMAVRELQGELPKGSPNMTELITHLGSYTVMHDKKPIHPYRWLSRGLLNSVLTRLMNADDLVGLGKRNALVEDGFVRDLGNYLDIRKQ